MKRRRVGSPLGSETGASTAEGTWACAVCTLENPSAFRRCQACESRRPVADAATVAVDPSRTASRSSPEPPPQQTEATASGAPCADASPSIAPGRHGSRRTRRRGAAKTLQSDRHRKREPPTPTAPEPADPGPIGSPPLSPARSGQSRTGELTEFNKTLCSVPVTGPPLERDGHAEDPLPLKPLDGHEAVVGNSQGCSAVQADDSMTPCQALSSECRHSPRFCCSVADVASLQELNDRERDHAHTWAVATTRPSASGSPRQASLTVATGSEESHSPLMSVGMEGAGQRSAVASVQSSTTQLPSTRAERRATLNITMPSRAGLRHSDCNPNHFFYTQATQSQLSIDDGYDRRPENSSQGRVETSDVRDSENDPSPLLVKTCDFHRQSEDRAVRYTTHSPVPSRPPDANSEILPGVEFEIHQEPCESMQVTTGDLDVTTACPLDWSSCQKHAEIGEGSYFVKSASASSHSHSKTSTVITSSAPSGQNLGTGFTTAGLGRVLSVSDEEIAHAAQLLDSHSVRKGTDPMCLIRSPPKATTSFAPPRVPVAFATAGSGKNIYVSDESLTKASGLLCDPRIVTEKPVDRLPTATPSFRTAGQGVTVRVSTQHMDRAAKLLDCPQRKSSSTMLIKSSAESTDKDFDFAVASSVPIRSLAAPAFASAGSGRVVSVSKESLAMANRLLHNDNSTTNVDTDSTSFVTSFKTAGRAQALTVSSDGMATATLLLNTKDELQMPPTAAASHMTDFSTINTHSHDAESLAFAAFTTAGSGKTITISNESLAKAHQLLLDNLPSTGRADAQSFNVLTSYSADGTRHALKVSGDDIADGFLFRGDGIAEKTPTIAPKAERNRTMDAGTDNISFTQRPGKSVNSADVCGLFRRSERIVANGASQPEAKDEVRAIHSSSCVDCGRRALDDSKSHVPRVSIGAAVEEPINPSDLLSTARPAPSRVSIETPYIRRQEETKCMLPKNWTHSQVQQVHSFRKAIANGDFVENYADCEKDGVNIYTMSVQSTNAGSLRFDGNTELPIGFMPWVSANAGASIGEVTDYSAALVNMGCNTCLITDVWIQNHVRWIIWKLASTERRFSPWLGGVYLTFSRVAENLLKRFNKEIASGSRPVLRKVLNRDLAANHLMILCVASIRMSKTNEPSLLELTDGWYSVRCLMEDIHLCRFVRNGRIKVGTKLLISNACLIGAENGVDPTDYGFDPFSADSPTLKISANATRLARWNAKLGLFPRADSEHCRGGLLCVSRISHILEGGGSVPCIDLFVRKKYPLQYLQRREENVANGQAVILTEAAESQRKVDYERKRQAIIEKHLETLQHECEKDVDADAPDDWHTYICHDSPEEYLNNISPEQQCEINRWQNKRMSRIQKLLESEMKTKLEDEIDSEFVASIPFLRLLVHSQSLSQTEAGSNDEAILTIWNPCEDLLELINEGSNISAVNIGVKEQRFNGKIQLTASSRTSFTRLSRSATTTSSSGEGDLTQTSIFHVHLLSRKTSDESSRVNLLGIIVCTSSRETSDGSFLYLTDRSGLVVRIQCEGQKLELDDTIRAFSCVPISDSVYYVVQLRNVKLLPFDDVERCAVAVFDSKSTAVSAAQILSFQQVEQWLKTSKGRSRFVELLHRTRAGIRSYVCCEGSYEIAVGYIAGYHLDRDTQAFFLYVDCGGDSLQLWKIHLLYLMNRLDDSLWGINDSVAFDPDSEQLLGSLNRLEGLLRARHQPYRFHLQRLAASEEVLHCRYKVVNIASISIEALASIYLQQNLE